MQSDIDLHHIDKQIQQDTADIDYARRQADNQRMMADQKYKENDPSGARYYEQEADRFENKADELQNQIDQLQTTKQRINVRIGELEAQRSQISRDHTARLAEIDHELSQLRGSGMMI